MYKKDKVAPLNLPLPFLWAVLPFFPSGAPHTPSPGEGKMRLPSRAGGRPGASAFPGQRPRGRRARAEGLGVERVSALVSEQSLRSVQEPPCSTVSAAAGGPKGCD